jgi:hypothetical protein
MTGIVYRRKKKQSAESSNVGTPMIVSAVEPEASGTGGTARERGRKAQGQQLCCPACFPTDQSLGLNRESNTHTHT